MTRQDQNKFPGGYREVTQRIWGGLFALMGIMLFIRIPGVTARVAENSGWSSGALTLARVSLYLVGIILLGGGIRKLASPGVPARKRPPQEGNDDHDGRES